MNRCEVPHSRHINAKDNDGDTALHRAARRKRVVWAGSAQTAAIKALLSEPQCDTTITNRLGDTAADIEHKLGHDNIIKISKHGIQSESK